LGSAIETASVAVLILHNTRACRLSRLAVGRRVAVSTGQLTWRS